jgi:hypothetical protein
MDTPQMVRANYRKALREIQILINEVTKLRVDDGLSCRQFGEDAILAAAVELYKHHNPWVQREYGTEPF